MKFFIFKLTLLTACLFAILPPLQAKPIAFADSWTLMHERDSDMLETDLYYAPTYWFSFGPTVAISRSSEKGIRREAKIMHVNFLLKRWNMPNAQGNIFATAGLGRVKTTNTPMPLSIHQLHIGSNANLMQERTENTRHATLQGDYETRQFYSSFKFDAHQASSFLDRVDTMQLGFSPYAHDYEDLAFWFIAQVKKKRGLHNETEGGAFVRVFKKNIWLEVGMTEGRRSQIMLMMTY
jgi:hypothetical protein